MRIGNVELATNLLLSPIAGYCDLAYRLVVRPLGGLGLAATELLNPRGLMNKTARSLQIAEMSDDDKPIAVQLYGTEAEELAEASKWAADNGAAIVDINMGCPVKKVAGKGGGCGLLRSPDNAVALVETVVKACPLPVTVKTRLGWEQGNLVAPAIARRFEDVGVAAITIHGRYGEQAFKGDACLDGIRAVVEQVRGIPVIGNGDVCSPQDAKRMLDATGCAGVMIGRWALADPWIFRDTHAFLTTGAIPEPPSKMERVDRIVRHFELMLKHLGERLAVTQFRKRMAWCAKTIGPCPNLRRQMPCLQSVAEFYELIDEFVRESDLSPTAELAKAS